MTDRAQQIGFSYFTSEKYFLSSHLDEWLSTVSGLGASSIIFQSSFERAVPEDAILMAEEYGLMPVVHFSTELPSARAFNQIAVLLDIYAKRGVNKVILGDRPNAKNAWPLSGWHYDGLVAHFLDRFIPIANHSLRIGMQPVLPPMEPGGDFWDISFIELVLSGLEQRKMESLTQNLILSSFGYTFDKPLTWGKGGPERWPGSKPYHTPSGQEDQRGFQNYAWLQAISERILDHKLPILILDAGLPFQFPKQKDRDTAFKGIRSVIKSLNNPQGKDAILDNGLVPKDSVLCCYFSLEKLNQLMAENMSTKELSDLFNRLKVTKQIIPEESNGKKLFSQYLLLPAHANNVSDVVLNKVRPVIKKFKPTVGFSLVEASFAENVFIYPDSILFKEEEINQLRSAGCKVEILPESGIEIATRLQVS